ncbi:CPBP family intramembrane glutamic endopeptidase [Actinomyces ruminis]|uniref:CPBP family intramembrane metalloprotease n=1 Tax=Actinomyces ruminis TaxID=1937003 RepID=A0ABX4MFY0_9ACTO|nr:CPBP family intramembrane glutamic endopeptidase [Actinomyces ruminis]PHP53062.1 CPBP family intramembrane metalloprotease [Actinomyces ruminis]
MPTTRIARIALISAITYIIGMGASNVIVYNFSHVSYYDAGYTKALLPFLFVLTLGTLACFAALREQLAPMHSGPGKYPLFLILFVPLVGMSLYYIFTNGSLTAAFLTPLAATLLVGIAEEMMFRRILYVGLTQERHGAQANRALLVSAIIFSLLHAVNLFAGAPLTKVLGQLGATFVAGLFFALMYDYTKSITLMITQHFLWDYVLVGGAADKLPVIGSAMGVLTAVQFIIMLVLLVKKWKQHKAVSARTE